VSLYTVSTGATIAAADLNQVVNAIGAGGGDVRQLKFVTQGTDNTSNAATSVYADATHTTYLTMPSITSTGGKILFGLFFGMGILGGTPSIYWSVNINGINYYVCGDTTPAAYRQHLSGSGFALTPALSNGTVYTPSLSINIQTAPTNWYLRANSQILGLSEFLTIIIAEVS
jgi:hypothetical protein